MSKIMQFVDSKLTTKSYLFELFSFKLYLISSKDSTNMLVANLKPLQLAIGIFVLTIPEFIFIATSHKHCAFTITYVCFENLSLFASYAMLMRHVIACLCYLYLSLYLALHFYHYLCI